MNKSKEKPAVWISPRQDGQWEVQREHSEKPSHVVPNKEEAVNTGREIARNNQTELIVQRRDGTIESKDSFGNDPNPPKDTEY